MKILHWDEMFHPTFGYQINLLAKYQAKEGHNVTVFTSDKISEHPTFKTFAINCNIEEEDRKYSEKYNVKIVRLPIYGCVSGRVIYKPGFIKKIKEYNPDVIMCHTSGTLSSMIITWAHKKIDKPIVFDNHMLEIASKNPLSNFFRIFYREFVTPVIIKNQFVVIKTQDDDYLNRCMGIPKEQTPFISFGSDTELFKPYLEEKEHFRKKNGISDDAFVVLYAGKLDDNKGGNLLAECAKKKFDTDRQIVFLIVGNTAGEYGNRVEKIFKESENTIIRFPTQKYGDLAQFYQAADLAVFPKQCSLSFYDVQASGLPVISEDNSVNAGRLMYNNGFCFKSGDMCDFREKVQTCINMSSALFNNMCESAREYVVKNYDYNDISQQYTDELAKVYRRFYKTNKSNGEKQW